MSARLWAGPFGSEYTMRNANAGRNRWPFWRDFYRTWPVSSVLEVGCGGGANLQWAIAPQVVGIDVNLDAVAMARERAPAALIIGAPASILHLLAPNSFELVMSVGYLIHLASADLAGVMDEMHRVSSKYLLVIEYHDSEEVEVAYRGQAQALWRRPYNRLFAERFRLDNVARGFLGKHRGFDDVHYDLWQKR